MNSSGSGVEAKAKMLFDLEGDRDTAAFVMGCQIVKIEDVPSILTADR